MFGHEIFAVILLSGDKKKNKKKQPGQAIKTKKSINAFLSALMESTIDYFAYTRRKPPDLLERQRLSES